jgi:hypothetical protein
MRIRISRRASLLPLAAVAVLLTSVAADGEVTQHGNLRVSVSAKLAPQRLPREGKSPISVSMDGQIKTTDGVLPPRLRQLKIEINREGHLEYAGLPVCHYSEIQPATNAAALAACRSALVGEGTFNSYITLRGQPPYPATGRLLVFNGRKGGNHLLLGHVYIAKPFTSSFIVSFSLSRKSHGTYGTVFTADVAKALGGRRYITGIDLELSRRYRSNGLRRSYLSAGCHAPAGFSAATFPLLRTTFGFVDKRSFRSIVFANCRVRPGG